MNVELINDFSKVMSVIEGARVRAMGWDLLPGAFVLDIDFALETEKIPENKTRVLLGRGWFVITQASNLRIDIGWGDFRDGFSILEIEESSPNREKNPLAPKKYHIITSFPEGDIYVSGSGATLVITKKTEWTDSLELAYEKRIILASESEFIQCFEREFNNLEGT